MGKQTITELPNILIEGIDYDNTLAEMRAIIENNPNWKENWTSFYNSEAGSQDLFRTQTIHLADDEKKFS